METVTDLDRAWYPRKTSAFRQNKFIDSTYSDQVCRLLFFYAFSIAEWQGFLI